MKRSSLKVSISILFLALFLMARVGSGIHHLAHHGEKGHISHCDVCELVMANHYFPIAPLEFYEYTYKNLEIPNHRDRFEGYTSVHHNKILINRLFSRPPPFRI
ncbi:hypothetical protein PY092_15045 [Muricauda sp. 334s03]|uniref:DUF2607 family protein n=1 Tax=Flagellimonas yonaguniensis TaxID=3031325 RepID=A0ABT5Y2B9_9FLAO|nr:hypothetical protein [[Muricauda] yonaguniensis]MDF0717479.1 hypothetical protein [[Muricauda] yonaguniensis]